MISKSAETTRSPLFEVTRVLARFHHDPMKTPTQFITAITQPATTSFLARPVILLLLSFSAGLASMQPCAATPFEWEYTGSLNTARFYHTATLLPNGKVLVAGGGQTDPYSASAELYNPATGSWSPTGSFDTGRIFHTATLLANGKVLVAGGRDPRLVELASADLYNPATGTWSATGSLNTARYDHTATLLLNGMVLVTGGALAHKAALATAELYDPGIVVSGQGSIHGQGDEATFEFDAKQSDNRPTGSLSFSDPAAGISITKAKLRTLTFNGNSADLGGTARLGDGRRVTYSVTAIDNSSD